MNMAPRSLLARIFLLVAALVLLTTAAWLTVFRFAEAQPRARESAQLASSAVNLVRAALVAAAPENRLELLNELTNREGVRLLPAEASDVVEPLPDQRFIELVRSELVARLGTGTRVALTVNNIPGFWVSFRLDEQDDDEFWLILPRERADRNFAWQLLAWGLLALGLALAVAWYIASRISQPLRILVRAAASVGRGVTPEPMPAVGAEELRRLVIAFNRMAADLARHEQDRAEVLAGISHDLRTPLTRLRLEAELSIADSGARDAVVADIEQMEAVIAQFMDYARGDRGEAPTAIDMNRLLAEIVARQRALGRILESSIAPLPTIAARHGALTRALTNLIDNACKYAGEPIELHATTGDEGVVIAVLDRGPGIPEGEIERLKRPFTRLENARSNVGGTGLGLAIVERIARLHGGRLDLSPREGGGLCARLILPLSP